MKKLLILALGSYAAFAAVGCASLQKPYPDLAQQPPDPVMKKADSFRPNSSAGVDVHPAGNGTALWAALTTGRAFSTRPDPFALLAKERAFEVQQTGERLYTEFGWHGVAFVPAQDVVIIPTVEPQPYRRLAGVIVADSIMALIDMGDGQLQLIRPGQVINGWTVVSIDGEKAVLRRGGNVLPHEVTVRLEQPPLGGGSGSGNSPGNNGGNPPGRPNTPPPGQPGSPGGGGPSGIGG